MSARLVSAKVLAARYTVEVSDVYKWTRCGVLPVIRITKRCARFDVDVCDRLTAFTPKQGSPSQGEKQ